jgi:hypothetical protein
MTVGLDNAVVPRGRVHARAHIVQIERAGILAHEVCTRGAAAHVAAIFERSFYLCAGEIFLCVGEPAIGNGPLTLIAGTSVQLSGLNLRPDEREIIIGERVRLCLDSCEVWRPPAWPNAAPPDMLRETCGALARRVNAAGPGLAPVVFGAPAPTPFARIASERIAQFQTWLVNAHTCGNKNGSPSFAVRDLIGLGPGLTPAGDDLLAGALAALDAFEEAEARGALAHAIMSALPGRTSPLSACLLRAAGAGHVGERLHKAVSALLVGDVEAAIEAADSIGHTSGWDMLAGAAAVSLIRWERLENFRRFAGVGMNLFPDNAQRDFQKVSAKRAVELGKFRP